MVTIFGVEFEVSRVFLDGVLQPRNEGTIICREKHSKADEMVVLGKQCLGIALKDGGVDLSTEICF